MTQTMSHIELTEQFFEARRYVSQAALEGDYDSATFRNYVGRMKEVISQALLAGEIALVGKLASDATRAIDHDANVKLKLKKPDLLYVLNEIPTRSYAVMQMVSTDRKVNLAIIDSLGRAMSKNWSDDTHSYQLKEFMTKLGKVNEGQDWAHAVHVLSERAGFRSMQSPILESLGYLPLKVAENNKATMRFLTDQFIASKGKLETQSHDERKGKRGLLFSDIEVLTRLAVVAKPSELVQISNQMYHMESKESGYLPRIFSLLPKTAESVKPFKQDLADEWVWDDDKKHIRRAYLREALRADSRLPIIAMTLQNLRDIYSTNEYLPEEAQASPAKVAQAIDHTFRAIEEEKRKRGNVTNATRDTEGLRFKNGIKNVARDDALELSDCYATYEAVKTFEI